MEGTHPMADGSESHEDLFDCRALFACVRALGEATVALTTAQDMLVAATGNSMHGATVYLLRQTALGLLNELGQQFAAMRTSENLDTRAFVEDVLAHLHAPERVTVPPDEADPTSEPPAS